MVIATGGEPGEMQLAQLPSLQRAVALVEVEGSCWHLALPAAAPGRRGAKSSASLLMFLLQPRISKHTDAFGSNLTSSLQPVSDDNLAIQAPVPQCRPTAKFQIACCMQPQSISAQ